MENLDWEESNMCKFNMCKFMTITKINVQEIVV